MLEVHEAQTRLLDAVSTLSPVTVSLGDAVGRTLAERVVADRDFPPTDRSAMDGYAVRTSDCKTPATSLRVTAELRAGQDAAGIRVDAGQAVRIFTGSVLPEGADAVVMIERIEEDRSKETVLVKDRPEAGQNIRRRGEDRAAGAPVALPGAIVRAAEIAALAAVGRVHVSVVRAPHVAVIATGDEVVDSGAIPAPHQIRDSNARMLLAGLSAMDVVTRDLGIVPDEPATLGASIVNGLSADVLILSGGVSVGAYDFVERALVDAGCEILFHRVSMRPGKPVLAARRDAQLVFGLPGNPVSAFTCFRLFVVPALRKLMGYPAPLVPTVRATLEAGLRRRPGRLTYHLGDFRWREGRPVVTPVESTSSGDVLALVRANAFIVAPGDSQTIPTGTDVDVLPWA